MPYAFTYFNAKKCQELFGDENILVFKFVNKEAVECNMEIDYLVVVTDKQICAFDRKCRLLAKITGFNIASALLLDD